MNSVDRESSYTVYQNDQGTIINHAQEGFNPSQVPLAMEYTGAQDGGYIAIYTRDPEEGKYSVGNEGGSTIYVAAFLRVQGTYIGNIFIPTAGARPYGLGDDITRDPILLAACKKHFPHLKSDVWVGGDTGGFFACQEQKSRASAPCRPCKPFRSPAHRRWSTMQASIVRQQQQKLLDAEKNAVIALGTQNISCTLQKKKKDLFLE